MEEKIEKSQLISFLKKISENTLTKEIEAEVPLGLPHGVYAGIRPQTIKIDVKWLIKQILNEFGELVKKEENVNIAICTKGFFNVFYGTRIIGADAYIKTILPGEKFIIVNKDNDTVALKLFDDDITFIISVLDYNEHFKDIN